jgi:DNA-binding transcriptional MerR regulator
METMTRSALARHLGCSRNTLWYLERRGVIPAAERTKRNRTMFGPAAVMAAESAIAAGRFTA